MLAAIPDQLMVQNTLLVYFIHMTNYVAYAANSRFYSALPREDIAKVVEGFQRSTEFDLGVNTKKEEVMVNFRSLLHWSILP